MTLTAEVTKIEGEFTGFIRTLELKFFKGKLHQKIVAPHTGQTPDHAWIPVESHDEAAPAPGEPIAVETAPTGSGESTPAGQAALAGSTPATLTGTLTTGTGTGAAEPPVLTEPVRYSDSGPIPATPRPVDIDTPHGVMPPTPQQPTPAVMAAQAGTATSK